MQIIEMLTFKDQDQQTHVSNERERFLVLLKESQQHTRKLVRTLQNSAKLGSCPLYERTGRNGRID
eukprot:2784020-Pyramimonas_sp.AAC.1